ncbi:MAG: PKD domain-containing protein, partial [Anaerolineae bacterium]|nr:PKD domain-containing protein [Anaerolineae bacterium]
ASLTVSNAAGSDTIAVVIQVNAALVAPIAQFSTDVTTGTAPLTVTFSNSSSGQIDSHSWDFNGDGVPDSNEVNPVFTYASEGTFNASLTVSNAAGSDTIAVVIQVNAALVAPIAQFSTDVTTGTAPLTVTFSNSSSGQIDTYSWDFNGDGVPDSNEINPVFTYASEGTFNASLTVSNAAGSDTIAIVIQVNAALTPPIAQFSADVTTGTAPLTVTFSNSSSGQIDSHSWDFNGDGVPDSNEINPVFTYASEGTFNASLTVSNAAGSNSATTTITVQSAAPPPPSVTGNIVLVSDRDGNNELYVINPDSSRVNLTNNPANDQQPVWSPNGSQIAFVSNRDGNNEIYILNVSDLSVTRLTNDGGNDQQPAWSPDGSQIAFVSDRFGDNDIFVMSAADGSNQVQRTTDVTNDRYPVWSPNGSQIAYVSDVFGNDDIFIINSSGGSGQVQLTTDGNNDTMPDWSSNNIIAYVSNKAGDNDVYTINPDGSGELPVATAASNDILPRWSPNASRILYTSNLAPDGSGGVVDFNIYTVNPDGSGQSAVTTEGSNESSSDER